MYSSHLIVVVVGFVDTLVEVNETDGQAALNVSITMPEGAIQIMFSLRVNSVDGSAGMEMAFINVMIFHECVSLTTRFFQNRYKNGSKSSVY